MSTLGACAGFELVWLVPGAAVAGLVCTGRPQNLRERKLYSFLLSNRDVASKELLEKKRTHKDFRRGTSGGARSRR